MQRVTLLLAIILAIAPTPATSAPPATRDARVQRWLASAERDVRAVAARPTTRPVEHFGKKIDLALVLVQTRPSEANRKLLREVVAQPMPPPEPPETPEIRAAHLHALRAFVHAACGEADAARAAAREFEQAVEKFPEGLVRTLAAFQLTQIYVWSGDLDAAKAAAAKQPMLGDPVDVRLSVARELYATGKHRERDQMIAEAIAEAKKIATPDDRASELRSIVRELAEGGDVDAALELARQMPPELGRIDAYQNLASVLAARGDRRRAAAALTAVFDTLDARAARAGHDAPWLYPSAAALAVELAEPALARRAVAAVEKSFRPSSASDAEANTAARTARTAAAIGDTDACARLLAGATAIIDRIADNEERARSMLLLAAAMARAGEKHAAVETVARAKAIHAEKHYRHSEGAHDVLTAFVDAGDVAFAEAFAAREFGLAGEDLDDLYQHELAVHLRAGEFDAARAQAVRITFEPHRFRALLRVALRQARAGAAEPEAVTTWVAALPEPSDRAAISLALAHQAMGIDLRHWVRGAYK